MREAVIGDGRHGTFPLLKDYPGSSGEVYYRRMHEGRDVYLEDVPELAQQATQQQQQQQRQLRGWQQPARQQYQQHATRHPQQQQRPLRQQQHAAQHGAWQQAQSGSGQPAASQPSNHPSVATTILSPSHSAAESGHPLPLPPQGQRQPARASAPPASHPGRISTASKSFIRALLAGGSCNAAPAAGARSPPPYPGLAPQQQQPAVLLAPPVLDRVQLRWPPGARVLQVHSCLEGDLSAPVLEDR